MLPHHIDDMIELANGSIWLYDPKEKVYKVYVRDYELRRQMRKIHGARPAATYSHSRGGVFAEDFLCQHFSMKQVTRLLEQKAPCNSPIENATV